MVKFDILPEIWQIILKKNQSEFRFKILHEVFQTVFHLFLKKSSRESFSNWSSNPENKLSKNLAWVALEFFSWIFQKISPGIALEIPPGCFKKYSRNFQNFFQGITRNLSRNNFTLNNLLSTFGKFPRELKSWPSDSSNSLIEHSFRKSFTDFQPLHSFGKKKKTQEILGKH